MKVCDRCRVPGCLLDYGGKACRNARKQECPDVVFTNADKIREMSDEELAAIIMCPVNGDGTTCVGVGGKSCIECSLEWNGGVEDHGDVSLEYGIARREHTVLLVSLFKVMNLIAFERLLITGQCAERKATSRKQRYVF